MTRWTEEQYNDYMAGQIATEVRKEKRKNKYNAQLTEYNGITYHSKAEANRASELDLLIKAEQVRFYIRQAPFDLPGNIKYLVDFIIFWSNGDVTFEDVKGLMTPTSKLKIKQVEDLYGIKITLVR